MPPAARGCAPLDWRKGFHPLTRFRGRRNGALRGSRCTEGAPRRGTCGGLELCELWLGSVNAVDVRKQELRGVHRVLASRGVGFSFFAGGGGGLLRSPAGGTTSGMHMAEGVREATLAAARMSRDKRTRCSEPPIPCPIHFPLPFTTKQKTQAFSSLRFQVAQIIRPLPPRGRWACRRRGRGNPRRSPHRRR